MQAYIYHPQTNEMTWAAEQVKPKPGKSQVQVKVIAASINPVDYKLPHVPFVSRQIKGRPVGIDFAGRVTIGSGQFKEGDVVFGKAVGGSLAEYSIANTAEIAHVPQGVDPKVAASLPVASLVSLQALRRGGVTEAGKNVLVIGASGGTGSSGVQIAKALGAKVYAVCSGKNVDFVKSLGADVVMDYTKEGFELPNDDCPAGTIDVVYDTVTSPEDVNYEPTARKTLKKGSMYMAINSPSRIDWLRFILSKSLPFNVQRSGYSMCLSDFNTKDLDYLAKLVAEKKLVIQFAEVLDFSEENCKKAYELQKSRRAKGKIILEMEH
ncbi:alcohol dehydrogenase, putative [Perkinsus marinus ATCC 50983]|uniref:Alcohol dehydrogenase, putative n=2 Tax=Perkinsus marinus (strain ATCC 50983 / TXsc) TaxID=423536 RepID=C5LND7_PERM5|nr:alcohol dehydrogenase, putative [Perkinsus marinus ATCC 50983]EER01757.1 alcohol dehydrogenase, putative [Perkinsus marinus ATCC 50983]|eukprot:XP_002769039.1 alcohol dehydrogenase, putative [Perkinsus marinus ATCC 50983]